MKRKLQIVSLCSLAAAFVVVPWIGDMFSALALGFAMNVGYRIDSPNSSWVINCCLAFGIILSCITGEHLIKYNTARDMVILVCTLPNLFMAQEFNRKSYNKTLWFFSPFYDRSLTYSIGFIFGMFLPLTSINKHIRFLIISLILLMATFIDKPFYLQILSLIRGCFIYDETRYAAELYFLIGFILVDIMEPTYMLNYLFVGYLVISVMLWHKD